MSAYFKYFITSSVLILLIVAFILLTIMDTHAQDVKPVMQRAPAGLSIDGSIKEWGDTLAFYDDKTKVNYAVAVDDTDIYVAVFSGNRQVTHKIMAAGITVSVNPEGKKSKKFSLTYPLPAKAAIFTRLKNGDDNADENKPPSLLQSTSIKVEGFKDVESDVITTSNTYGFKAATKFDDKHNLGYEIAIPLKFLSYKPGKDKEFAINISVNGVEHPQQNRREGNNVEGIGGSGGFGGGGFGGAGGRMGGGGRGGRGERPGGSVPDQSGQSDMNKSEDFWVKMALPSQ